MGGGRETATAVELVVGGRVVVVDVVVVVVAGVVVVVGDGEAVGVVLTSPSTS